MVGTRIIITAPTQKKWALITTQDHDGLVATSVSPGVEAGVERLVPGGGRWTVRPGVAVLMFAMDTDSCSSSSAFASADAC